MFKYNGGINFHGNGDAWIYFQLFMRIHDPYNNKVARD